MKKLLPLLLALAILAGCYPAGEMPAITAPSPAPDGEPAPVLALLGSALEPWYEPLCQTAEDWAAEKGWQLVCYDCDGSEAGQGVQVDDLVRGGGAAAAVLCPVGRGERLQDWVRALRRGDIPVITVSTQTGQAAPGVRWHIGLGEEELLAAAAEYFRGQGGEDRGVLLLPDVQVDARVDGAYSAFADAGVPILDLGHTWTGEDFAKRYALEALDRFPQAAGVVCFSRVGTRGVYAALTERGEKTEPVRLLSLQCTKTLLEDLERGEVDCVLGVSAGEMGDLLREALDRMTAGERFGVLSLTPQIITPANRRQLELGY